MNNSNINKIFFFLFLGFFMPHTVVAQTIGFTVASSEIDENGGSIVLTVERDPQAQSFLNPLSIDFTSESGSASAGSDYQSVSGTLNWSTNESGSKTISIPIVDDADVESNESFSVVLSNCQVSFSSTGAPVSCASAINSNINQTISNQNVTIRDDDIADRGDIGFSPTVYTVNEDQGTVTISVIRNNGQSGDISIAYQTVDKTATAGSDYQSSNGTLSWVDQEIGTKTFTVPILNDSLVEPLEAFEIQLSNATDGVNLQNSIAEVNIEDTTKPGSLAFASTSISVIEGNTAQLTVTRSSGQAGAISVNFQTINKTAIAGSDYQSAAGTLTWADQESGSKTFNIAILADTLVEPSETFEIQLSNASNGVIIQNSIAEVTIEDATNPGTLAFGGPITTSEGEIAQITVSRSGGQAGAITVNFQTADKTATAGSDYQSTNGTLSWADREGGSKTFNVPILTDTLLESSETFEIQLSNASDGVSIQNNITEVTIEDITNPGTLVFANTSITTNEGETAQITVTREGGQAGAISVNFQTIDKTAIAGSDYQSTNGTLSWADQEGGAKTFPVAILTDTLAEPSETFDIQLSNATEGVNIQNTVAEVNINDAGINLGSLALAATSISVNEGETAQITVNRQGGVDSAFTINYQTENETAQSGEDYQSATGTLSWADQETGSKTIDIATIGDTNSEATETFKISFNSPSDGSALLGQSVTVSIVDVKSPGAISLARSVVTTSEGAFLEVEVVRQSGSDGEVSVNYATSDLQVSGSAIAGIDYTPVSGTLTWSSGDTNPKVVKIPISRDFATQGRRSFLFRLTSPQGATLGGIQQMTITIENKLSSLQSLPGLTPQQREMAKMLDEACVQAHGDLLTRCGEILRGEFTEVELKDILQELLPNEISSMGSTVVKLGSIQLDNLTERLSALRRGQRGFSAEGLSVSVDGEALPLGKMLASLNQPLGGGASSDILSNEKFGFFIHGKISVGDRDQTAKETGFEFSTQGITVGIDYYFNDALVMGTAFGYGHTDTDFDQSKGEMDTNAILAAFYGSYYFPESFYMDWIMAYGFHDFETDRNIRYNNADFVASSTPEGNQYDVALSFGKDINWQQWLLNSYARVEYQVVDIESYDESGGHGFALNVGEQAVNSFTSALGGNLIYNWSQSWGILSPGVRFEWEHQYMDNSRTINTRFVNSNAKGGILSLATDKTDRNYFNLGATINATFSHGRSAFLLYETRLGQEHISSHTVEIGVRIPF